MFIAEANRRWVQAENRPPIGRTKGRQFILLRMQLRFFSGLLCALCFAAGLSGCSTPVAKPPQAEVPRPASEPVRPVQSEQGNEVTIYALGLLNTDYRFGGKNPDAGLDCSGMVSYIYERATGLRLKGSAADIARQGRNIERAQLRPGDLVFFNTRNAPFSHVGVYIGGQRFVHAPSSNGKVRIDLLTTNYYAQRFETARTYFD